MERRRMSEFDRQHVRSSGIPSQTQPTYESTRLTRAHDMAALERGGRVIFPENRCEKKMVMHVPGYHMMKKDHVFIQFSHDVEVAAAELHRRRMPPPPVPINSNGTTWTEEEHRLFLLGHKRYGMGDWRNISRSHFVASTSTTPTQNVLMQRDVFFTDSGLVQLPTYPNHMEVPEAPAAEVHRRMPPPPPIKKGTPWTVEEHRLFLDGLEIYGKGDWKSISRYCVVSRTSTQVASHAQKFFIRQEAPKKERKRKSIHDITIGNYHNWVPLPDVATQQLQELQQAQELKQAQESRQAQEMFHPNPPNNSPEAGPSNDGFGKFEF